MFAVWKELLGLDSELNPASTLGKGKGSVQARSNRSHNALPCSLPPTGRSWISIHGAGNAAKDASRVTWDKATRKFPLD